MMLETPTRRGLITSLVSFLAAPAIVRASSLMPLRGVPLAAPVALAPIEIIHPIGWTAMLKFELDKINRTIRLVAMRSTDGGGEWKTIVSPPQAA